jgi:predicted transcriptional regulator
MPRPKSEHPTRAELEVLKLLWRRGPCSVRQVWQVLNQQRRRHYTSTASLLAAMAEKGLLTSEVRRRTLIYRAVAAEAKTLGRMVEDLLERAFSGSASALVLRVLDQCRPSPAEMGEIAKILRKHRKEQGEK